MGSQRRRRRQPNGGNIAPLPCAKTTHALLYGTLLILLSLASLPPSHAPIPCSLSRPSCQFRLAAREHHISTASSNAAVDKLFDNLDSVDGDGNLCTTSEEFKQALRLLKAEAKSMQSQREALREQARKMCVQHC